MEQEEIKETEIVHNGKSREEEEEERRLVESVNRLRRSVLGEEFFKHQKASLPRMPTERARNGPTSPRKKKLLAMKSKEAPFRVSNTDKLLQVMRTSKDPPHMFEERAKTITKSSTKKEKGKDVDMNELTIDHKETLSLSPKRASHDVVCTVPIQEQQNDYRDPRNIMEGTQVRTKVYRGYGSYEWQPCVVKDQQGSYYLVEIPPATSKDSTQATGEGQPIVKWVTWTNVWNEAQETLEQHLQNSQRQGLSSPKLDLQALVSDPTIPLDFLWNKNVPTVNAFFLQERISALGFDVFARLVFKAKPHLHKFKVQVDTCLPDKTHQGTSVDKKKESKRKSSNNSPEIWTRLLEEIHEGYLEAQVAICINQKLARGDKPVLTAARVPLVPFGQASVKKLSKRLLNLCGRFSSSGVRTLQEIKLSCLYYESKVRLFHVLDENAELMVLSDFSHLQHNALTKAVEKLNSNWIVEVYHILKKQLLHDPVFQNSTLLGNFLRLVELTITDTISSIIRLSVNDFRATFKRKSSSPLLTFSVHLVHETRMEKLAKQADADGKQSHAVVASSDDWVVNHGKDSTETKTKRRKKKRKLDSKDEHDAVSSEMLLSEGMSTTQNEDASSDGGSEGGFGSYSSEGSLSQSDDDSSEGEQDFIFTKDISEQEVFGMSATPTVEKFSQDVELVFERLMAAMTRFPSIRALVFDDPSIEEHVTVSIAEDCTLEGEEALQDTRSSFIADGRKILDFAQTFIEELDLQQADMEPFERSQFLFKETARLPASMGSGVFLADFQPIKQHLFQRAQALREKVCSDVLKNALESCAVIHTAYSQERAKLTVSSRSMEALEEVWTQVERVPRTVRQLSRKIEKFVSSRFNFLDEHQFQVSFEDLKKRWETFSLPRKLWSRSQQMRFDLEARKQDLKSSLLEQLDKHQKKVTDYFKYTDAVSNYSDVSRIEENAVNSSLLEENILACHSKTLELCKRAELFGVASFGEDLLQLSLELVHHIKPIAVIWGAAADLVELAATWTRGSLLRLQSDEVVSKVQSIRENEHVKTLNPQEPLFGHIEALAGQIIQTERLVRAISSKGMQRTHWVDFAERFGIRYFEPTFETTLEEVLTNHADLLPCLDELEHLAQHATKEYQAEAAIDEMENQFRKIVTRNPPPPLWEFQVVVESQLHRLEQLEEEVVELAPSCASRIRLWKQHVLSLYDKREKEYEVEAQKESQKLEAVRNLDPRFLLLSEEILLENLDKQDLFKLIPHLYPFYAIPSHMIGSTTKRRNLLEPQADSSEKRSDEEEDSAMERERTSNVRVVPMLGSVVNDVGEKLQLRSACALKTFPQLEAAVSDALKSSVQECLHFLGSNLSISGGNLLAAGSACDGLRSIPSSEDVLMNFVKRWPRQVCELVIRILLTDANRAAQVGKLQRAKHGKSIRQFSSMKQTLSVALATRKLAPPKWDEWHLAVGHDLYMLAQALKRATVRAAKFRSMRKNFDGLSSHDAVLRTIESLLLITSNQRDIQGSGTPFEYDLLPNGDVEVITEFKDSLGSCLYGYEFVSGQLPTFLVLPSCQWHLSVTKTFYHARDSIFVAEENIQAVQALAAALGKCCPLLRCESAEQFMRVQTGVLQTSMWAILQDRCSWSQLCQIHVEDSGVVFTSRKQKLPTHLQEKLRVCQINVNLEVLRKQALVKEQLEKYASRGAGSQATTSRRKSIVAEVRVDESNLDTEEDAEEDHSGERSSVQQPSKRTVLELFLTRYSDWRDWEARIHTFLRRVGEASWVGKPSKIIVHDARTPQEREKNPECCELLERLQNPTVTRDVTWKFVFHSAAFIPQPRLLREPLHEVSEPTFLLLRQDHFKILQYMVSIPSVEELQAANENGKDVGIKIVCFEESEELKLIEEDFPRVKRCATRYKLDPWWLDQSSLEKRTEFDDPAMICILAEEFLATVVQPGVRPEHYTEFVQRTRQILPGRLNDVSLLLEKYSKKLDQVNSLLKAGRGEQEMAALKNEQAHHQNILRNLTKELEELPRQVIRQAAEELAAAIKKL